MPSTAYLLGAPLVLLLPVYLFRRLRPWGAILPAVVLAMEAYACLRLPPDADAGQASASFSKGVLSISVPKSAQAQSKVKKIDVKTS